MEEKYRELKRSGKSENEAIGIVISEFGNINELIDELGITTDNNKLIVDKDEVQAYQKRKEKERDIYWYWRIFVYIRSSIIT